MNISHLVRGMTGEAKPGDSRTLELRSGQVVRGVVTSVSDNGQEAIVQINGVPVKAALETPMRPGQTTWMQVQGQQEDGLIILKQAEGHPSQPLPTIGDALKQAGLPDEPWARSMLHDLQKSGTPLTKETMAQLGKAMAMKPDGVSLDVWMQTAALAMKRNLPLTAETMRGLQTVLFGKPMHEMLTQMIRSSETWLGGQSASGSTSAMAGTVKDALALVRTLMAMMPNSSDGGNAGLDSGNGGAARGGQASAAVAGGATAPLAGTASGGQASGSSATATASAQQGVTSQAQSQANSAGGTISASGTSQAGVSGAQGATAQAGAVASQGTVAQAGSGSAPGASVQAGAGNAQGAVAQVGAGSAGSAATGANASVAAPQPQAGGNPPADAVAGRQAAASGSQGVGPDAAAQRPMGAPVNGGALIGRMLELLGVSHEQQVQRSLLQHSAATAAPAAPQADAPPTSAGAQGAPQQASPGGADSARAGAPMARLGADGAPVATSATLPAAAVAQQSVAPAAAADSLKSTLLQLLQNDQLPPAVREAAQQLVHHITGQQLLLTSDRSMPFAHVTLHVPFMTPDGRQTAAVHIQARQGRKGELDAGNCRLWFDLELKVLGRTLVDVNVVDKLVALNIHHPNEQVQEVLQSYRTEIDQALEGIGYQLSAFRVQPPPEKRSNAPETVRMMDDYTPTPYKGVDLRV